MMEEMMIRLLNMSFAAGCTAGIVAVLRLFLKRAPKGYSYALWLAVLFRFLCPVVPSSPLSLFPVNPEPMRQEIIYQENPEIETGIIWIDQRVNQVMGESLAADNPANSVNPIQIWLAVGCVIWEAGVVVLAGYHGSQWIRLHRRLATAVRRNQGDENAGSAYGSYDGPETGGENQGSCGKGRIPVWESDQIEGAFVLGVFRPAIYLPEGLSAESRHYILCHEQIHVRRKDYLIKLLGLTAATIHWFNPLAWLAFRMMCQDMEMSCDEAVLAELEEKGREAYSRVLLAEAEKRSKIVLPLAFGKSPIYQRIQNILSFRRPGRVLGWGMAALVVIGGIGLATSPGRGKAMGDKAAMSVSIIGGADGPTSIFLAGKIPEEGEPVWQKEQPDSQWLASVKLKGKAIIKEGGQTSGENLRQPEPAQSTGSAVYLDYASENSLIFHGDFGLFSFSKEGDCWQQEMYLQDADTGSRLAEALETLIPQGQETSQEPISLEDGFHLINMINESGTEQNVSVMEYSGKKMPDGRIALLGAVLPGEETGSLRDLFYGYYDPSRQIMTQAFLFYQDNQEVTNRPGELRIPTAK